MAYGTGAWIAAAAAEKRRRVLRAEEEMTTYTRDDLANDWEFKIVRSDSAAFRNPQVLSQLVEEEAQAGWTMLEKLDNSRVRFKRPRSASAQDAYLPEGVDPYRTHYGAPSARYAVLVGVLVGVLALGIFVFLLVERAAGPPVVWGSIAGLIPLIFIILGFVLLVARRRS